MLIPELSKLRNKRVNFIDMTGSTYGRWTVLKRAENNSKGLAMRLCRCECGNEKVVDGYVIRRGQSTSCGCVHKEVITTHGFARRTNGKKPRIYNIYQVMRKRCNNPNDDHYNDYGGRGIRCERDDFESFYEDMGYDYELHIEQYGSKNTSIDRINVNGNYNKTNCRRATVKEQANNRRNSKAVLANELKKLRNKNNDPLTWGRIFMLYENRGDKLAQTEGILGSLPLMIDIYTDVKRIFNANRQLYDQNELQWQQHAKRPELKGLLIQFSDYI